MLSCLDAPDALGKRESEWKLIAMPSIYTNNPYSRRHIFPLERSDTSTAINHARRHNFR